MGNIVETGARLLQIWYKQNNIKTPYELNDILYNFRADSWGADELTHFHIEGKPSGDWKKDLNYVTAMSLKNSSAGSIFNSFYRNLKTQEAPSKFGTVINDLIVHKLKLGNDVKSWMEGIIKLMNTNI